MAASVAQTRPRTWCYEHEKTLIVVHPSQEVSIEREALDIPRVGLPGKPDSDFFDPGFLRSFREVPIQRSGQ